MNLDFVKFPSTPHLLWLGTSAPRGDKVLSRADSMIFLRDVVVVEEKVDGANLGISFDAQGELRLQNRGHTLERGTKGQFALLWAWISRHEGTLFDVLEDRHILFGEWCYARHSVPYKKLPDYFLCFDIYDKHEHKFMSSNRRNELVAKLKLATVPEICRGHFNLSDILVLIDHSSLYDGPMEGVYLRQESPMWLMNRAKIVRANFVQENCTHWSKQQLTPNQLLHKVGQYHTYSQ